MMGRVAITSLNLNGIRSATNKGLIDWINSSNYDIICFQELKAHEEDIPSEVRSLNYYQYYHPAEKKGYSGVGILTRQEPIAVQYGIGVDWIDREGRVLLLEYGDWSIASVYAPSGTTGEQRQEMKYLFLDAFDLFVEKNKAEGKRVIYVGDFNIAHQEIDIHNPISNKKSSGFLPEERAWFSTFLNRGFTDVFRALHPNLRDVYSWWSFRAGSRGNNKGWRIDYQVASSALDDQLLEATIETDVNLSDHAPVTCVYDL
jgi:exodeoxyribonuclease-3